MVEYDHINPPPERFLGKLINNFTPVLEGFVFLSVE